MGICAVWGSPQSGKTTLSVNLAYAISRGDKTVCLISPVEYSELSAYLGMNIPKEQSLNAALHGSAGIRQTVFKVDELFFVLAASVTADVFDDNYSSDQVKALLELAGITFDYVIVDCPSHANNLFAAWSLNKAEHVALCLGGHVTDIMWHTANKRAIQPISPKAIRICSENVSAFDYTAMQQHLKLKPTVVFPYVSEATLLQNEQEFIYGQKGKKATAYSKAINKVYEVIS
jgi:hypothetical protein